MFKELETNIMQCTRNIEKLNKLKLQFSKEQGFDEQDGAIVQKYIDKTKKNCQLLKNELKKKQYIYETGILKMEKAITKRHKLLESTSNDVFQNYPELLNYFTDKQRKLSSELKTIKTEIGILS